MELHPALIPDTKLDFQSVFSPNATEKALRERLVSPTLLVTLLKTADPPTTKTLKICLRRAARREAKAARTRPKKFKVKLGTDELRCLSLAMPTPTLI